MQCSAAFQIARGTGMPLLWQSAMPATPATQPAPLPTADSSGRCPRPGHSRTGGSGLQLAECANNDTKAAAAIATLSPPGCFQWPAGASVGQKAAAAGPGVSGGSSRTAAAGRAQQSGAAGEAGAMPVGANSTPSSPACACAPCKRSRRPPTTLSRRRWRADGLLCLRPSDRCLLCEASANLEAAAQDGLAAERWVACGC